MYKEHPSQYNYTTEGAKQTFKNTREFHGWMNYPADAVGRYVLVRQRVVECLHIAEIEVYGNVLNATVVDNTDTVADISDNRLSNRENDKSQHGPRPTMRPDFPRETTTQPTQPHQ